MRIFTDSLTVRFSIANFSPDMDFYTMQLVFDTCNQVEYWLTT
jgi:hypothetical protein